jgi:hypothetical protein
VEGATDPQQAFTLHSRPSATRKLHLEFQGCVTEVSSLQGAVIKAGGCSPTWHGTGSRECSRASRSRRSHRAAQSSCMHHDRAMQGRQQLPDKQGVAFSGGIVLCVQLTQAELLACPPMATGLHCRLHIPHNFTKGTDGWNKYYGVDAIVTPPYDTDGNATVYNDEERHDIITIHAGAYVSVPAKYTHMHHVYWYPQHCTLHGAQRPTDTC